MFEYLNCRIPKRIEEDLEHVSAVMVPLLKKTDGYHILFEVRSKKLNRQPGEICFPGGRVEPGETPKEAALRETQEELLIESKDLKLYGALDYFLSPAQARIEPFLGELTNYHGQFSEAEVDSVFTVPLQYFLETPPDIYYNHVMIEPPKNFPFSDIPGGTNYPWATGRYEVCFYRYQGHVIWGMTAKILSNNLKYLAKEL